MRGWFMVAYGCIAVLVFCGVIAMAIHDRKDDPWNQTMTAFVIAVFWPMTFITIGMLALLDHYRKPGG